MTKVIAHNRTAWFGWAIMIGWMAMLGMVTWLVAREGSFGDMPPILGLGLLGLMWVFGVGFSRVIFSKPTVTLLQTKGRLVVRRRWLFGQDEDVFSSNDIPLMRVIETEDSEGDPYFKLLLILDRRDPVAIAESHDRVRVEQERERIEDALRAA